MEIRKKVNTVYNNRKEDFSSLRAYNDYLEMVCFVCLFVCLFVWKVTLELIFKKKKKVEDLCQRLIENKNDEKANSEMHEYELKNEAIISRNKEFVGRDKKGRGASDLQCLLGFDKTKETNKLGEKLRFFFLSLSFFLSFFLSFLLSFFLSSFLLGEGFVTYFPFLIYITIPFPKNITGRRRKKTKERMGAKS